MIEKSRRDTSSDCHPQISGINGLKELGERVKVAIAREWLAEQRGA
ncbi:hypothetical protein NDA01_31470 [Trichocoleus desertorum AS-A10]